MGSISSVDSDDSLNKHNNAFFSRLLAGAFFPVASIKANSDTELSDDENDSEPKRLSDNAMITGGAAAVASGLMALSSAKTEKDKNQETTDEKTDKNKTNEGSNENKDIKEN